MEKISVEFGPKVELLLGIRLAQLALKKCDGDEDSAGEMVRKDASNGYVLAEIALKQVIAAIGILKSLPDCPHGNDENIAADILRGMGIDPETGQTLGGHHQFIRKTR